jgi:hypothetical protein
MNEIGRVHRTLLLTVTVVHEVGAGLFFPLLRAVENNITGVQR